VTTSWLPSPQVRNFSSSKYPPSGADTIKTGCAISWDGEFKAKGKKSGKVFSDVIDLVLNCVCFIYIGAWIPFSKFTLPELGITPERLVALAIGIMILRRIPALLLLYKFIPEIDSWKQALFCGHFGPVSPLCVSYPDRFSWRVPMSL
jgi:NhaP-type Na+/H+ or K+/H+ antiporter